MGGGVRAAQMFHSANVKNILKVIELLNLGSTARLHLTLLKGPAATGRYCVYVYPSPCTVTANPPNVNTISISEKPYM